jgi:hypothetical protein
MNSRWLTYIKPIISTDEVWTTKDGTEIPVGQMTEDHVRAALRLMLGNAKKKSRSPAPLPYAFNSQLSNIQ